MLILLGENGLFQVTMSQYILGCTHVVHTGGASLLSIEIYFDRLIDCRSPGPVQFVVSSNEITAIQAQCANGFHKVVCS